MTDYNVRDVFFLYTGRCGHKWVAEHYWRECPTCNDRDVNGKHLIAQERIAVNIGDADGLRKVERRIKRAIRDGRKRCQTAAVISLSAHRPQPVPLPGPSSPSAV